MHTFCNTPIIEWNVQILEYSNYSRDRRNMGSLLGMRMVGSGRMEELPRDTGPPLGEGHVHYIGRNNGFNRSIHMSECIQLYTFNIGHL